MSECGCTSELTCVEHVNQAMAQARAEALREAEEEAKDAASRVATGRTSMAAKGCAVAALTAFAAKLHEMALAAGTPASTPPAEPGDVRAVGHKGTD